MQVPNSSLFPEIDFASKCIGSTGDSNDMADLLYPASNTGFGDLRKRLSGKKFYVGDIGGGQMAVRLNQLNGL